MPLLAESARDRLRTHKVVLVGNAKVGKTCLLNRLVGAPGFTEYYKPTIGVEFLTRPLIGAEDGATLQIWDTAGQPRFRAVAALYYRAAGVLVACYSCTDPESYRAVDSYVIEAREHCPDAPILVLGLQARHPERCVFASLPPWSPQTHHRYPASVRRRVRVWLLLWHCRPGFAGGGVGELATHAVPWIADGGEDSWASRYPGIPHLECDARANSGTEAVLGAVLDLLLLLPQPAAPATAAPATADPPDDRRGTTTTRGPKQKPQGLVRALLDSLWRRPR